MPVRKWLYWLLVVALLAFGSVAILSVGAPFLLVGLTLAILWPYRTRPQVFWPTLFGVVAFVVGYIVVAPLVCTGEGYAATTVGGPGADPVEEIFITCVSALGITYTGRGSYNPPLWPAFLAAISLAVIGVFATRFLLAKRGKDRLPATSQ